MPLDFDSFGLEVFRKEEAFRGMVQYAAQEGEPITGYYGLPYFNHHYGKVQIILRTKKREDDEGFELTGVDTHARGYAIWNVRLGMPNIERKDADKLERRVTITRADKTGGMAVVSIVNADVLPSFMEDDTVSLQMIGLPELIQYYADEEEYAEDQPKLPDGKSFLLEPGMVFPSGLLKNRNPGDPHFDEDEHLDDICNIRGPVKSLRYGVFELNGEKFDSFIFCTIDTEYGPLEIVHTAQQVDEKERSNIREGAIVSFYGTLSGDAAIDEYAHGIVRDEEHDLALLRYSLSKGDPERLRAVLADNAVYETYYKSLVYHGPDEIISGIKRTQEALKEEGTEFWARLATVVGTEEKGGPLQYGIGKRCLALSYNREDECEAAVFLDVGDDGIISRILISNDSGYQLETDPVPVADSIFDKVDPPESVIEPMIYRAKFQGIIDEDVTVEIIANDCVHGVEYSNNIRQMMDALPDADEGDEEEEYFRNMFGYLFAKTAEMEYTENLPHSSFEPVCSYVPDDAWNGRIQSGLSPELQTRLENAMDLGRQFYKDYSFFAESNPEKPQAELLEQALMTVQILGRRYSRRCFGQEE